MSSDYTPASPHLHLTKIFNGQLNIVVFSVSYSLAWNLLIPKTNTVKAKQTKQNEHYQNVAIYFHSNSLTYQLHFGCLNLIAFFRRSLPFNLPTLLYILACKMSRLAPSPLGGAYVRSQKVLSVFQKTWCKWFSALYFLLHIFG